MSQTYEELLAEYKGRVGAPKDPEEIAARRHAYYLKRKAEGTIKKPDPEKVREYQRERYKQKKAEAEAAGVSVSEYLKLKPKKYDPKKRVEYYQKWKAEGKTQKYYKEKMAKDPLFNRKEHIKRKAANVNWQTVKGSRENFQYWSNVVKFIRESVDMPHQELVQKLSDDWWICRRYNKPKSVEGKTVYRPRVTNKVLSEEEIKELDNFALSQGLSSQHELIRTTVSYFGELKDIDSREENKEVDIYTAQEVDKDYSEEEKLHTVIQDLRQKNTKGQRLYATRERERERSGNDI